MAAGPQYTEDLPTRQHRHYRSSIFWKDVCMMFQCFIIMAGLLALLCGWEWRKVVCTDIEGPDYEYGNLQAAPEAVEPKDCPTAPPPAPAPVVHKYSGHEDYTDQQKAAYAICDVSFSHYVRSGQNTLTAIHDQCKTVLATAKALGVHKYKDYVKYCIEHGTAMLADQKAHDGKMFHDGCVDYIVGVSQNVTLLKLREGAVDFAESGKFTRLSRKHIAPDAVAFVIEEAKKDAAEGKGEQAAQ